MNSDANQKYYHSHKLDDEIKETGQHRRTTPILHRRNSFSENLSRQEFLVNIETTQAIILRHEDTDGDERVTIEDRGPKHVKLPSVRSAGYQFRSITGNYRISTLLQELALMDTAGPAHLQIGPAPLATVGEQIVISEAQLMINPVERLLRMIKNHFWPALKRSIDAEGLNLICSDPKNRAGNKMPRIYIPSTDARALEYFQRVTHNKPYLGLELVQLPVMITPEYVLSLNDRPGILCLDLYEPSDSDDHPKEGLTLKGKPFVVPGGRFNEMYGWDSYFCALGLLEDVQGENGKDNLLIVAGMVDNLVYEIEHYGKILNANRSYYLLRSQPPLLTDMILRTFQKLIQSSLATVYGVPLEEWLRRGMRAAIDEYRRVWMTEPRYVPDVGLSRYFTPGRGIPPETEASHFDSVLSPFALKHNLDIPSFIRAYNDGTIREAELDEYFAHDRAVRESGHDTTYRLDGRAANLCTIDLCALLYKYETDLAIYLERYGDKGRVTMSDGAVYTCEYFYEAAARRRTLADQYLWDEERGMYFDYDIVKEEQSTYESVTMFWAMWAGMCSEQQARLLMSKALPLFEEAGGLVSGTRTSLGHVSLNQPNRQWDYPLGWAPHQILAWNGLHRYGFEEDARRLAYRWLWMITRAFSDYNGVVPEKFDVVKMSHKLEIEYGNVGTEFKRVPREGFGWMNASYLVGLSYLNRLERRALETLVPVESLIKSKAFI